MFFGALPELQAFFMQDNCTSMNVHTLRFWVLFLEENKDSQRALKYKIFRVAILATFQHLPEDLIVIFWPLLML